MTKSWHVRHLVAPEGMAASTVNILNYTFDCGIPSFVPCNSNTWFNCAALETKTLDSTDINVRTTWTKLLTLDELLPKLTCNIEENTT